MAEKIERILDTTASRADQVKNQTADALEEAARKLREASASAKSEEIKRILHDVENRMNRLGEEIGVGYQKMETEYHKRVEPVEMLISNHPIPSVMVAAGIGFLLGALLFKSRE
jgi:ElaB/YqjD/DUF883 family membrane-anchored ribosome-binding protein